MTIVTHETWKQNCYVVQHIPSSEQIVIDPGDEPKTIIDAVLQGGDKLEHVLLTHGHFDHVGAAQSVCQYFNVSCRLHAADLPLLRRAPNYGLRYNGKEIQGVEHCESFESRAEIPFGGMAIDVVHSPGHSPGSVCYRFSGAVFSGDVLMYQRIGHVDFPGGDAAALSASVTRLVAALPDGTTIFPGHGRPWNSFDAKRWWHDYIN